MKGSSDEVLKNFDIRFYDRVTSTNDIARELAESEADEFTVVLANSQTNGRGRMGRSFFSPCDTGIYMSVILRPKLPVEKSLYVTVMAAAAVAEAIEKNTGLTVGIKWVNDVFCAGRKVCGILAESVLSEDMTSMKYIVLGVGINVSQPKNGFPEKIKDIAGAVSESTDVLKEKLIADFLGIFRQYYSALPETEFALSYKSRMFLTGKQIDIGCFGHRERVTVTGIDSEFALNVVTADGTAKKITSGEVEKIYIGEERIFHKQ